MQLDFITPDHPRWLTLLATDRHDIYQLPGYLNLEAQRTHAQPEGAIITAGDRQLFVPYLQRQGDDGAPPAAALAPVTDVVSPYGYPGMLANEAARHQPAFITAALRCLQAEWQQRGICSAFLRLHPILNGGWPLGFTEAEYCFQGQTVSVDLTLPEAEMWRHISRERRNRINRAQREQLTARMVPWHTALTTFVEIYAETMGRVAAASRYLEFDAAYFTQLGEVLGDRLHLCLVELGNEVVAAGLYTEWDGIVQAIFGGTRTAFIKLSPSTLETYVVMQWAKARGHQFLHLGGGVGATEDSLFRYKAGFSQMRHAFYTLRLITDPPRYEALVQQRAHALGVPTATLYESGYFPAYRAPVGMIAAIDHKN